MKNIIALLLLFFLNSLSAQIDTITVSWWNVSGWGGGCGFYVNKVDDPIIELNRGNSCFFIVNTFGHPFVIEGIVDSLITDSLIYIHEDILDTLSYKCLYSCEHPNGGFNHNCWMTDPFHDFDAGNLVIIHNNPTAVFNRKSIISYKLMQNYPNPFNPKTTINYELSKSSNVTIKIYNILGKEIETLVDEYNSAGKYKIEFDGRDFTSGVYFCKMTANNYTEINKLILLK